MADGGGALVAYDYAVLRAVAHPHLGAAVASVPVGVVVHARTAEFLDLAVADDEAWLAARVPGADAGMLARYLRAARAVCRGEAGAPPWVHAVALAPTSERFHWVTAPRSDVLQCAPVHGGLCADPAAALRRLFALYVGVPGGGAAAVR
ncbi:hypothetical protein tb265_17150 [Gemmatimonadetes bacterium T265]|nr:hypothetical protein tb265_17150 [Gemmatimonadetes bacterium T265]